MAGSKTFRSFSATVNAAPAPIARRAWIAIDWFYRITMRPFGRRRRQGSAVESAQLVSTTDSLNRAADAYFTAFSDHEYLLSKPFSDGQGFPRTLFNLGAILTSLDVRPGQVVVEFGAGSCWVSHFLNRFGCKTISVDVSRNALDLGRAMFERSASTRWELCPEFVPYDGHSLPLADASCDRIVVFDAFHHVPNQREILKEMLRILRPDGLVGMSEPGLGHADSDASRHEVDTYGVLENELVIEDVGALAKSCGFNEAMVVIGGADALRQIPTDDLGNFLQGKHFVKYWDTLSDALVASHFIVLHKSDPRPSTLRPRDLGAAITIRSGLPIRMKAGRPRSVLLRLKNLTDTRWLAQERDGWTRVGAHLYRAGDPPTLLDFDWVRTALPQTVESGGRVDVEIILPAIAEPGSYDVVFDLVVEGKAWFAEKGSTPTSALVVVSA